MRPLLALLTALAATLMLTAPARAQGPAPSPAPHATDAQLELLYAAHDWHALGTALTQNLDLAYALHGRDWLRAKLETGAPFFVAQLYAGALWWTGNAQNLDGPNLDGPDNDRIKSASATLYAFELLAIDGAICADRTAPSQHAGKLFHLRARTMDELRAQPPAIRQRAIDDAIALERKTAPLRQADPSLCHGGRAEMEAGMKGGGTPHPVEGTQGAIAMEGPPGWTPTLLPPETAAAAAAQNRANMPTTLRNLVEDQHP